MAGAQMAASAPSSEVPIYNPEVGYLNAEARRTIDSPTFGTSPSSVRIPTDTVIKRMYIKLIASFDVTYSSGSPTTSPEGLFGRICPQIEVNVNGNRIIKSVNPNLMRMHNILINGSLPRRAYTLVGASAPTVTRASREWVAGTVAFATTTQFMLFNEGFEMFFENPFGYAGSRYMSELDVRDIASADLRFYWAPLTEAQGQGVGATVTYGNSSIVVKNQMIENRARPRPQAGQTLFDYVESTISKQYTGQGSQQINLQTGNYLQAIGIQCKNGDSLFTPVENLLTSIALKINGATALQGPVSHQDLQDSNISRYGAPDDMGFAAYLATIASVADVHPLRGFALMNLIRNGSWDTSLNTSRQNGVDSCNLEFNTPLSTGTDPATYTNPLVVTAHTHEIRPYAYTR